MTTELGQSQNSSNSITPALSCSCIKIDFDIQMVGGQENFTFYLNVMLESGDIDNPDSRLTACEDKLPSTWNLIADNALFYIDGSTRADIYSVPITVDNDNEGTWVFPEFFFKNTGQNEPWKVETWISPAPAPTSPPLASIPFVDAKNFYVSSDGPGAFLSGGTLSGNGNTWFGNAIPNNANSPTSNTWLVSNDIVIDGNLFANGQNTPNGSMLRILMKPEAQITVSSTGNFNMNAVDIIGCDFLHDGIVVDGVFNATGTDFMDASRAVRINSGGTASIQSSKFQNNLQGIELFGQTGQTKPRLLTCNNNNFDILEEDLKPFLNPPAINPERFGIKASNAAGLVIGFCNFSRVEHGIRAIRTDVFGSFNTFDKLNIGAENFNSTLFQLGDDYTNGLPIYSNYFTGAKNAIISRAVRISHFQKNEIKVCDNGIECRNALKNSDLQCLDNKISTVRAGIQCSNNMAFKPTAKIDNNQIFVDGTITNFNGLGISMINGNNLLNVTNNNIKIKKGAYGIKLTNNRENTYSQNNVTIVNNELNFPVCVDMNDCKNSVFQCNSMERNPALPLTEDNQTIGLRSQSCSEVEIYCNTTNDTKRGMFFDDMGLVAMQGNYFANHTFGLELAVMGIIGPQYQPGTNLGYGNRWVNNTTNPVLGKYGAWHNSLDPNLVQASAFKVNNNPNNSGNIEFEPLNNVGSVWFDKNPLGFISPCGLLGTSCPPSPNPGFVPETGEEFRIKVANGTVNSLNIPEAMKAKSKLDLIRFLDENSVYLSNPVYNNFHTQNQNTSIGAFYLIEKGIKNLPSLSASNKTTIEQQGQILKNALSGIWQINQTATPDIAQRNIYFNPMPFAPLTKVKKRN
jgi:hypothetical protein